jgi:phosphoribosyl-ATP pyrophosphohydrolase
MAMRDSITRLYEQRWPASTTMRQLPARRGCSAPIGGRQQKKFGEEATKAAIAAISGDRDALILQSADLIYNLVILWISVGIDPEAVWKRMRRSEPLLSTTRRRRKKR